MGSTGSMSLGNRFVAILLAVLLLFVICGSVHAQQGMTIPSNHPRLWWTPARISQAQAWYAAHPFTPDSGDALGNAFRYVCTGETAYAQTAINLLMAFTISQSELDGVSSDHYRWADWVPLVFDWCYNEMTPTQRSDFMARYNGYVLDIMQHSWGGPGMPASNYYTGYFRNELNWAIATWYESGSASTILNFAMVNRWQNAFLPYAATGTGLGGIPPEGTQYGRYMVGYPVCPLITARLCGRDMYNETNFYKEAFFYFIYASTTGQVYTKGGASQYYQMYSFDDSEQSPFPAAGANYNGDNDYGNFIQAVANEWSAVPIGQYARYVLNTFPVTCSNWITAVDNGGTATNFSGLPLDYYGPGYRGFYVKNSWNAAATQAWIQIGHLNNGGGHQHLDWGSFHIVRGDRWLTRETAGYAGTATGWGGTGTIGSGDTLNHNGLLFSGNNWHIGCAAGYQDGETNVTRMESRTDYAYIAADLTGVYTARTSNYLNGDGSPRDDNPFAQTVVREFLFVRPLETWVVFDRMLSCDNTRFPPTVLAANVIKTFVLHCENSPTIQDSNHVLITNGSQALRVTTLLPSTISYATVYDNASGGSDYAQNRLEINHSGEAQSYFLNVLQARASGGADLTASVTDDGSTYTVTLTHPTLGNAKVVFTKGATSTGGQFGYAASGQPTLSNLTTTVQGISVTDNGPVWSGTVLTIGTTSLPSDTVNVAYNQTLSAVGGTAPYTWAITSGSLPAGLTLVASTGAITGTPTASGTSSFTARVTDNASATATKALSIVVNVAPSITTSNLPNGQVGVGYSQTLAASGGTSPLTWSIQSGSLPAGLSLTASTGAITGTPTASGTSSFTAKVTDNVGASATRALSIAVAAGALSITTSSLPNAVVGVSYNQSMTAVGGTTPYTWAISSGSLPAGLTLVASTGAITGTPTTSGTSSFTARVTDNASATATKALSIVVGTSSGTTYFVATNGSDSYPGTSGQPWLTLQHAVDAISAGDTIVVKDGTYAGCRMDTIPGASGAVKTLKAEHHLGAILNAKSGSASHNSIVELEDSGYWDVEDFSISATGCDHAIDVRTSEYATIKNCETYGSSKGTTFTAFSDYSLIESNVFHGATAEHGFYASNSADYGTVRGNTSYGNAGCGLQLNADASMGGDGTMSYWTLEKNTCYNNSSTAGAGLNFDGIWDSKVLNNLFYGNHRNGIALYSADGANGSSRDLLYNNTIVTPSDGFWCISIAFAGLGTNPADNKIKNCILMNDHATRGSIIAYSSSMGANFQSDYNAVLDRFSVDQDNETVISLATWRGYGYDAHSFITTKSALFVNPATNDYHLKAGSPAINAGTTLTEVTDDIAGTARPQGGVYDVGCYETTGSTLSITTSSLPADTVNVAYNQTLQATGGTTPYTWAISSGSLPAGLTLVASTGAITGTPTASGTSSFTARVTDNASATATQALSIVVNAPVSITTSSLPNGTVSTAYSQTLAATGGTGALSWSLNAGSLPAGLSLTSGGVISGTPTATGTSNFTVKATDTVNATATKALSIVVVNGPPTITTSSLPADTINIAYNQTLAASGGTTPYTWSISGGSLPAGLSLVASTGAITGTPTASGTSSFTAMVTDNASATATKALSIVVNAAVSITTASLPNGAVSSAYSQTLAATGGTGSLSWSLNAGSLPAGLSLTSGGVISGTPTASGTSNFTVKATDTVSASATKALSIVVTAGSADPTYWQTSSDTVSQTTSGTYVNKVTLTFTPTASDDYLVIAYAEHNVNAAGNERQYAQITIDGVVAGQECRRSRAGDWFPFYSMKLTTLSAASHTVAIDFCSDGVGTASIRNARIIALRKAALEWFQTAADSQQALSTTPTDFVTLNFTPSSAGDYLLLWAAEVHSNNGIDSPVRSRLDGVTVHDTSINNKGDDVAETAPLATFVAQNLTAAQHTMTVQASTPSGTAQWIRRCRVAAVRLTGSRFANYAYAADDNESTTASTTFTQKLSKTWTSGSTGNWLALMNSSTAQTGAWRTIETQMQYNDTTTVSTNLHILMSAGEYLPASGVGVVNVAGGSRQMDVDYRTTDASWAAKIKNVHMALLPLDDGGGSPLSITTSSLPADTVNVAYNQTLSATGGTTPYTWAISSGSLPAGLSLVAGTGAITGTPTASGTSSFTARVTDNASATATQALSIVVNAAVTVTTASLPADTINVAYNQTLAATGGTGALTWSLNAGSLPTGLSLTSGGSITGTPTAAGTSNFTVKATDTVTASATKALSIVVNAAVSITTSSLPADTVGIAYNQTMAATGGTGALTWSISSGSLPTGLSLVAATGAITGTPSASGTSNFTAMATDTLGANGTKALSIVVNAPVSITTSSLPADTVNIAYNQALAATGGTGALTWSLNAGTLPTGLSLTSGGSITGTPTAAGTSNFTVKATDTLTASATKALSIVVNAAPSITTSSLPADTVNIAYNQTLAATGGTSPLAWAISSGSLPAGLSIVASTGAITGTPTASGTSSFTARVTDNVGATATQALSIVGNAAPSITTSSLPNGNVGASYNQTMAATGGTAPLTWAISSGSLPAGLSLVASTGAITGTPTASGTSNFTARVTDNVGATATKALSIVVTSTLAITTSSLPATTVGATYNQTLAATGGATPYTWAISSGSLPSGLSLVAGTGAITGTPSASGTSNFTARVTDNVSATATQALSIVVNAAISVTTSSLPADTVGIAYNQTLAATGGTGALTWSISSGSLPAGLSLVAATGAITGTPTTAGTSNFTAMATDTVSATGTKALSITVNAAISITTSSLPADTISVAYNQALAATGGTGALTWSLNAGSLPTGLSLTSGGSITGTPTASGTSNFTVKATDTLTASATKALSIVVNAAPSITTSSLPATTVGATYNQTLASTGGTSPLSWSISSGSLPAGLSIVASTGAITGTPTTSGTSSFTARVTDNVGATATKALSIVVNAAVTITTASLPADTVNVAYNQTLTATGGTGAPTWSISSGTLPTGLSLSSSTGAITGTPTVSGTSNFTAMATDTVSATGTKALSIVINATPSITTSSLPGGTVGTAYNQTMIATGGTGALAWSLESGSLPAGLSLNSSTGAITGTPTTAGTSNFTAKATDTLSASGTKALSIVVSTGGGGGSVTLQDGLNGYTGTTDTWLNSDYPTTNYGTIDQGHLQYNTQDRQLHRFDVSSIPSNATVTSATISFYVYNVAGGTPSVSCYRVLTHWDEMQATYNNRLTSNAWGTPGLSSGTDYDATAVGTSGSISAAGWVSFTATSLVQGWVNGSYANEGVMYKEGTTGHLYTYMREYAIDTSKRPKLDVTYTTGGEPTYQFAASDSEATTTSTNYTNKATLSFTPGVSDTWVIMGFAELKNSSTTRLTSAQLTVDGAVAQDTTLAPKNATDYQSFVGMKVVTLSAAAHTINIDYKTSQSSGTAYIRYARIVAIRQASLLVNSADEGDSGHDVTTTMTDYATTSFTPATAGDYLLIWSTAFNGNTTSYSTNVEARLNGTAQDTCSARANSTSNYVTFVSFQLANLPASAQTISLAAAKQSGSSAVHHVKRSRVAAIRLTGDRYASYQANSSDGESTTTSTTFQNKLTKSWTPAATGNWLMLSSFRMTNSSTNYSTEAQVTVDDTTTSAQPMKRIQAGTDYLPMGSVDVRNLTAASHHVDVNYRSTGTSGTAKIKYVRFIGLPL